VHEATPVPITKPEWGSLLLLTLLRGRLARGLDEFGLHVLLLLKTLARFLIFDRRHVFGSHDDKAADFSSLAQSQIARAAMPGRENERFLLSPGCKTACLWPI
jgi:hypothetical protein